MQILFKLLFLWSIVDLSIQQKREGGDGKTKDWCHSCDDPHMMTFGGVNYEFQFSGLYQVMYTDFQDTTVTAGFQPCNVAYPTPTCNCAVRVQFGSVELVLDTCGMLLPGFSFFSISPTGFQLENCDASVVPSGSETDDAWWNTIGNPHDVANANQIFCALSAVGTNSYYIKTNNGGSSIYVQLYVHSRGISCIFIKPPTSLPITTITDGLCGQWGSNGYVDGPSVWYLPGGRKRAVNGYDQKLVNLANDDDLKKLANFWRLQKFPPKNLDYLTLDAIDCPLDDKVADANIVDKCAKSPSKYVAENLGPRYIREQGHVRSAQFNDRVGGNPQFFCDNILMDATIRKARDLGLVDTTELLNECLSDLKKTGDIYWAVWQNQVARNLAIQNCVNDQSLTGLCEELQKPTKDVVDLMGLAVSYDALLEQGE